MLQLTRCRYITSPDDFVVSSRPISSSTTTFPLQHNSFTQPQDHTNTRATQVTEEMHLSLGEALRVLVPFFALVSAAPSAPTTLVKLSFALEPADPTLLDRTLHEISDPLSPRYGQHLTRDEAHALVAPRDESADVVKRWLAEAGVPRHEITHEGRWIHANVPAGHAKRLAADAGLDASSDIKRSLADSLSDHVSHVHRSDPNVREGQPTRRSVKARDMDVRPRNLGEEQGPELEKHKPDLKNCHKQVTPACLREWYKIPEKKQKPAKGNLFGVIGFLEVCQLLRMLFFPY